MLAVDREERGTGSAAGLGKERAGGDEGLLVGERDLAAELGGGERGGEAADADDCGDDHVGLCLADEAFGCVVSRPCECVAWFAGGEGCCWPGRGELAEQAGV